MNAKQELCGSFVLFVGNKIHHGFHFKTNGQKIQDFFIKFCLNDCIPWSQEYTNVFTAQFLGNKRRRPSF